MDLHLQLMSRVETLIGDVMLWQRSAEMCSRDAHNVMNALILVWVLLLIFSVWLYRRINPAKTKKEVCKHLKAEARCPPSFDSQSPYITAGEKSCPKT